MRRHLTNAVRGVLDYPSCPIGMPLVAPAVLHRLSTAECGLWMITTAIISAGGNTSSSFCDASIQRVAHLRGAGDSERIADSVRSIPGYGAVALIVYLPLLPRLIREPQKAKQAAALTAGYELQKGLKL